MKRSEAQRDIEELNEFYAGLTQQSDQQTQSKTSRLAQKLKKATRKRNQKYDQANLNRKEQVRASILSIGGSESALTEKQLSKPPKKSFREKIRSIRTWVKNLNPIWKPWLKLATILTSLFLLLLLVWFGMYVYKLISRSESGPTDLTPSIVYVPHNLPEGFSIGSGAQKLENGAQFYTVYDDKGHAITITQHSLPVDFDYSIFGGASGIDTPLGKAYVVESKLRTTGYVIAKDTMLLFNTVPDIDPQVLLELMIAFQP